MEKKQRTDRVISPATLDRYLSAILLLRGRLPLVRSVDVANQLGYSKACVSMSLKQMTREELVAIESHGALTLTDEGERRARKHLEKCRYFQILLERSGVETGPAREEASAMSRVLSSRSFNALARYLAEKGVPAPESGES